MTSTKVLDINCTQILTRLKSRIEAEAILSLALISSKINAITQAIIVLTSHEKILNGLQMSSVYNDDKRCSALFPLLFTSSKLLRQQYPILVEDLSVSLESLFNVKVSIRQFSQQNLALATELNIAGCRELSEEKREIGQLEAELCLKVELVLSTTTTTQISSYNTTGAGTTTTGTTAQHKQNQNVSVDPSSSICPPLSHQLQLQTIVPPPMGNIPTGIIRFTGTTGAGTEQTSLAKSNNFIIQDTTLSKTIHTGEYNIIHDDRNRNEHDVTFQMFSSHVSRKRLREENNSSPSINDKCNELLNHLQHHACKESSVSDTPGNASCTASTDPSSPIPFDDDHNHDTDHDIGQEGIFISKKRCPTEVETMSSSEPSSPPPPCEHPVVVGNGVDGVTVCFSDDFIKSPTSASTSERSSQEILISRC